MSQGIRWAAAVAGLMLLIGALLLSTKSARAHGGCGGDADPPFKNTSGSTIYGPVQYLCDENHDKFQVSGCLQVKSAATGNWINADCVGDTIGPGLTSAKGIARRSQINCSTGNYRTRFDHGAPFNNSGALAHEQTANEYAPRIDSDPNGVNIQC